MMPAVRPTKSARITAATPVAAATTRVPTVRFVFRTVALLAVEPMRVAQTISVAMTATNAQKHWVNASTTVSVQMALAAMTTTSALISDWLGRRSVFA